MFGYPIAQYGVEDDFLSHEILGWDVLPDIVLDWDVLSYLIDGGS